MVDSDEERKAKRAAYMREYTRKNADKVNARRRERYHDEPDRVLAAQREYNARPEVKERTREYNAAYHAKVENRERRKQRDSTPEAKAKKKAADRAYREKLGDIARQKSLLRYYADPEKTIVRNRDWRRRNPEKILAKNQRRRAAKMSVVVEHVLPSDIYTRDGGMCKLCGLSVRKDEMTLDHIIPISKGGPHVSSNLQLAHRSCNSSKGAKLVLAVKPLRRRAT